MYTLLLSSDAGFRKILDECDDDTIRTKGVRRIKKDEKQFRLYVLRDSLAYYLHDHYPESGVNPYVFEDASQDVLHYIASLEPDELKRLYLDYVEIDMVKEDLIQFNRLRRIVLLSEIFMWNLGDVVRMDQVRWN